MKTAACLPIDILANDYLADVPTTVTLIDHTTTYTVLDGLGNPVTDGSANVTWDGTNLLYEPRDNFNGTDQFTYTITDSTVTRPPQP